MAKEKKEKSMEIRIENVSSVTERSKYIYNLINYWIQNADDKVNTSCTFFSVVFGIIYFFANQVKDKTNIVGCWFCVYQVCLYLSIILMVIAIFFFVYAINPNLGSSGENENVSGKRFPLFYGDIARIKLEHYKTLMRQANDEDFLDELYNEIHFNSRICDNKMKRYRNGLRFSLGAILLAGVSLAIRLIMG